MMKVQQALETAEKKLLQHDNPRLEAQLLLSKALDITRVKLITYPERVMSEKENDLFEIYLNRRVHGEPMAYILGEREFLSLAFIVTADTLIPRPETETLVEVVLSQLTAQHCTVADLGTGSGIIACSLAKLRPQWHLIAIDNSNKAIEIAKQNAAQLKIQNIKFLHNHWLDNMAGHSFDAIVSNPPYLSEDDPHLKQGDLRFEPQGALVGGASGLECYEQIIQQAQGCLKPNGLLAFEHGFNQGETLAQMLNRAGFKNIKTFNDLSNHPRVTLGIKG